MKRYQKVLLSDRTKEIILGTILGDGSLKIQKKYKNARLQFRHSEKDSDYFYGKVKELKEVAGPKSVHIQKADGYSKNRKLSFISRALEELTKINELTYKKNKLQIKRSGLNNMSALSLAVGGLDDGSLIGEGGRRGVICTDGFDKKSVKILSQYLDKVGHIKNKVAPVNRPRDGKQEQYGRIGIRSTEELKKFLRIIIPHIYSKDMLRKVLLLYKDSQDQQRWISEIVTLGNFSKEDILSELEKKKSKGRKFR